MFDSLPSDPGDVKQYVLGNSELQTAIALYLHEAVILESEKGIEWFPEWESEVEMFKTIKWNISNSIWQPCLVKKGTSKNSQYYDFMNNTSTDLLDILKQQLLEN